MGSQRTSFGKLQRDRDKKAKAAAKRERRLDGRRAADEPAAADATDVEQHDEVSATELLGLIDELHRRFESRQIDDEEFADEKARLLARLPID